MTAEDIKDDMDDAGSGMGSDEGARPGESEEDLKNRKRKERLEQNRISARESRKRKKTMIEELQRTVITLSRENKGLNERNETLRRQLMDIGAKYPNIVPLQAIVGQGAAQAAATDGSNPGAIGIQQQQQQQASSTVTASSAAQPIQTDAVAPPATANGPVASAMSAFNPLQWFPGATGAPAPTPAAGNSQAPAAAPAPTNQANV